MEIISSLDSARLITDTKVNIFTTCLREAENYNLERGKLQCEKLQSPL